MLSVALNWIYIFITSYIVGYAVLKKIAQIPCLYTLKGTKKLTYAYKYNASYLVAGIVALTVYAQLFSLIGGVGLLANIILLLTCIFLFISDRDNYVCEFDKIYRTVINSGSVWIYVIIFLAFAYGTSHGIMHYDTDLYHAQAIRWIEEYGAVKGLGNLHLRLGYNSSAFALSALYSFSFTGKSMHTVAGFFALALAFSCADLKNIASRRHPVLSDFVRVIAVYYLFTVFDEIVSPASDYFMTTMVLFIVIHWLDLYSLHERAFLPHALLALCAVYVTTIKLSAAPLLLLAIYPIHRIIKRRKKEAVKPIGICILFALLIAVPFFIRNVILTGWLVYPFTGIDIFAAIWEVPRGTAMYDAHEIIAYGKGFTDSLKYNAPFTEWFPSWFSALSMFNKGMLILDVIAFPIFIGSLVYFVVVDVISKRMSSGKLKKDTNNVFHLSHRKAVSLSDYVFIEAIAYICLIYFLMSSPLIRYGCVYIWLPVTILAGRFLILLYDRAGFAGTSVVYRVVLGMLVVYMVYKSAMLIVEDVPRFRASYLLVQQDYGQYDLKETEIEGITFYEPIEGDRTGYDKFPAAPTLSGFKLLGSKLEDGFEAAQ